jgi:hypothetical protein
MIGFIKSSAVYFILQGEENKVGLSTCCFCYQLPVVRFEIKG